MSTALAVKVINGNPVERILVIAPSYRYFADWCREHEINPQSGNVRFVDSDQRLRGYSNAWYVNLGVPYRTGLGLLRMLEYMKAARGFKSAEISRALGQQP